MLIKIIPLYLNQENKGVKEVGYFNDYLNNIEQPDHRKKMEAIFNWVDTTFPELDKVIKWNQPMFTAHETFIIGFSVSKPHFSVSPETKCLEQFADAIENAGYSHTDNIFRIKWTEPIDQALIEDMIAFNLKDKAEMTRFWR